MIGDSREDKINEAKEIDWGNIKISEILPNPAGDDATKEWIRLYNQGDTKVNLYNWSIDDAPGGSKPYTFGDAVWLEAGQHFTLSREDSRLALNNSGDEIRLYNPKQKLVDKLDYTKTREGISLKRIADGSLALDKEPEGTRIVAKQRVRKKASQPRRKKIIKKIVLSELNSIAVGTKIKTEGVVAVEPGILSSQYFYISGDGGIQVYSYHKSFPALQVGDYISVRGELSKVGSEQRIKISQASDITLIRKDSPPLAIKCSCADMSDKVPGSLVELDGEIVAKKGLKLFIDDGSAEAVVYIKESTGINDSVLLAGRKVSITGILNKTSGELRLMPRFSADIVLAGEDLSGDEAGRVLGESSETSEWDLEQRDKKNRLFPYAVLGLVFVVSLLGALLIKKYLL
jgi:DNA/RNA endonuclease YhcR with UshA esterase domain